VVHASKIGWNELSDGLLITAAEADGFEALITCDQTLEYRQNMPGRRLALIILSTNIWAILRAALSPVVGAAAAADANSYQFVRFDRSALWCRPFTPQSGR
jgi:hypothetical protein